MRLIGDDRAALGFYLDNDRVNVGDADSCLDDVLAAWSRERAGGRDCLMLAPTRELVSELNLRAQVSRDLTGASVKLADGCQAHHGDVVISRRNDRRLGVSGTDWVKNGDRWIVTDVRTDGGPSVRHATSRLHATLPAEYVREHVELGYASTVHTAPGITTGVAHRIVARDGPLPCLAGIPDDIAEHPSWGPYLAARSRRVMSLAADLAADPVLPEWMARYDGDVLTPELRRELAVWRAAVGVSDNERTMAGEVPRDDREASYHRHLTKRIGARYGDAVQVWADRIVEYAAKRDKQTAELAKHLDPLAPA